MDKVREALLKGQRDSQLLDGRDYDPAPWNDALIEHKRLCKWRDETLPLVAALAIYGERANLRALVAKARELNEGEVEERPVLGRASARHGREGRS